MPVQAKLGRQPRVFRPTIPFAALLGAGSLPARPDAINYGDGITNWGMMLNDIYGCCTCAAKGHQLQVWTGKARHWQVTIPDSLILQLYEAFGFDPQHPGSTDNGAVMQDVNRYITDHGIPIQPVDGRTVHKILGWCEVDHRNLDHVRRAIYVFGACDIGFEVPAFIMSGSSKTWDYNSGMQVNIEGGHDVALVGYDEDGFHLVSWGEMYYMTNAFFHEFVDESYGLASPSWLDNTGHTPANMSKQQLTDILQQRW